MNGNKKVTLPLVITTLLAAAIWNIHLVIDLAHGTADGLLLLCAIMWDVCAVLWLIRWIKARTHDSTAANDDER